MQTTHGAEVKLGCTKAINLSWEQIAIEHEDKNLIPFFLLSFAPQKLID